ncbi:hypothetical protein [Winogradskyella sp. A3E31]|uniref:hypothetical protein n=1 Tax=Winogradskyella sp. A3E31 TaxID=3349637 RepID=UPI00398B4945
MKNISLCFLLMVFVLASSTINAQSDFAKIRKNKNSRAAGLYHDLNKTKDTLVLKSDSKINYAYAIDTENDSKKTEFRIDGTSFKIPLNQFKKGRHVFVAVQSPLEIVFVINVLQDAKPQLDLKPLKSVIKEAVVGTDEEEIEN